MTQKNIQVFARCRPLRDGESNRAVLLDEDAKEIKVIKSENEVRTFKLDQVFPEKSRQIDIYMVVISPLINQLLLGYNCAVFAYGPTGTGKTFTMEGEKLESITSWEADSLCGIIPRTIRQLFETLEERGNQFSIKVSFLELYNEEAYDLLTPIEDTTRLKIYDKGQGSVVVDTLQKIDLHSKDEIYHILKQGSNKRQTAATRLNACSSRSHTIFTIQVQLNNPKDCHTKIGKINLIDLAGSENIGRSGAHDIRAREAGSINQSLLTLGRVIQALVDNAPHIPYRESKLTRLLQDSLGGTTKTSIIATISPAATDLEHTLNALEYAARAKRVPIKTTNPLPKNSNLSRSYSTDEYSLQDLREYYESKMCEREYEIRNEVSKEFRKESESIRNHLEDRYQKQIAELNEGLVKAYNMAGKYKAELEDSNKTRDQYQEENCKLKKQLEVAEAKLISFESQLVEKLEESNQSSDKYREENCKLKKQLEDSEAKLITFESQLVEKLQDSNNTRDKYREENSKLKKQLEDAEEKQMTFKSRLIEKQAEIEKLNEELSSQNIQNTQQDTQLNTQLNTQQNNYLNMTFDDQDEIAQVSVKKAKKQVIKKRELNEQLVMSGKKRKIQSHDDSISNLSPIEPKKRITRSQASRKKLVY